VREKQYPISPHGEWCEIKKDSGGGGAGSAGRTAGWSGPGKDADASGVESAKAMAGLRRGTLVKTVDAKLIHFAGTS
jgi:hypothetical protein